MKTIIKWNLGVIALLWVLMPQAQQMQEKCKSKLQKLSFMEGEWSGSGWTVNQDQSRETFSQEETISYELQGTILHIRGKGHNEDGEMIHNALGVIYYDAKEDKYFMQSFLDTGQQIRANFEPSQDGYKWWFSDGNGGTIQYTATFDQGKWVEKGAYSRDGEQWYPFMEFQLTLAD